MVWPGMNKVDAIPDFASSASSRSVPTMPKSPREIMVGVALPPAMEAEVLSRSKVRQTKCCGMTPILSGLASTCRAAHRAQGDADQAGQRDHRPRRLDDDG